VTRSRVKLQTRRGRGTVAPRRPGPSRIHKEGPMSGFTYKLEHPDGTPAEPPTLTSAVPNWGPDDTIPLGGGRKLRVLATRERRAGRGPGPRRGGRLARGFGEPLDRVLVEDQCRGAPRKGSPCASKLASLSSSSRFSCPWPPARPPRTKASTSRAPCSPARRTRTRSRPARSTT